MNAAQVAAEWARVFTLGKARGKIAELFEGDRSRAQRQPRCVQHASQGPA